jgi:hypothetical protein
LEASLARCVTLAFQDIRERCVSKHVHCFADGLGSHPRIHVRICMLEYLVLHNCTRGQGSHPLGRGIQQCSAGERSRLFAATHFTYQYKPQWRLLLAMHFAAHAPRLAPRLASFGACLLPLVPSFPALTVARPSACTSPHGVGCNVRLVVIIMIAQIHLRITRSRPNRSQVTRN